MEMNNGLVVLSQGVSCGEGDIILTAGTEANVRCQGIFYSVTFVPALPNGLSFSNETIRGTPTEGSPLTKYSIINRKSVVGTFVLGGSFSYPN